MCLYKNFRSDAGLYSPIPPPVISEGGEGGEGGREGGGEGERGREGGGRGGREIECCSSFYLLF